jgi:hypothetical protein
MFILTIDQELWTQVLMCRIMSCDYSLDFKEFLDQLNLLSRYLNMFIFTID